MKTIFTALIALILFTGCEDGEKRYTTQSDNIDDVKTGLKAYEDQDWDSWKALYSEDAEIYPNNWDNALTSDQVLAWHKDLMANLDSRGWRDEPQFFEEIVDDEGKTWVNSWLVWEGKVKGSDKQISVPVHLSSNVVDGKVVEEYGFWNMAELEAEINNLTDIPVEEQKLMDARNKFLDEFLNNKNEDVLNEILADNYTRYMNGEIESKGKQGLIDGMGVFNTGFPDLKLENPHQTVKGNSIFVHWTFTGTNTGEFLDNPPTGKKVTIEGMSELKFNSAGKLYEEHVFYNQLDMMQQLGYTLSPPAN